ncbi:hypothetical protein CQR37_15380 [Enterococcus faecium]|uniref:Uncharacterized protein n=1 Tax=Enterococcus faecium TaxID=1352 RepID=A0A2G0E753_ENTFC|nr:hypothetical protein CQR37_15380 [Enterococcus faecium]
MYLAEQFSRISRVLFRFFIGLFFFSFPSISFVMYAITCYLLLYESLRSPLHDYVGESFVLVAFGRSDCNYFLSYALE